MFIVVASRNIKKHLHTFFHLPFGLMLKWIASWVGLNILISVRVVHAYETRRKRENKMRRSEIKYIFLYFLIKTEEKFCFLSLHPVAAVWFVVQQKIDADDDDWKDMVSWRADALPKAGNVSGWKWKETITICTVNAFRVTRHCLISRHCCLSFNLINYISFLLLKMFIVSCS